MAINRRWVALTGAAVLVGAGIGFFAAVSMPSGCNSPTLDGKSVYGMDCLSTIEHDGVAVPLLTNRPADAGQKITVREVNQAVDDLLPRLPAGTRTLCTQRRGIDRLAVCRAVAVDASRTAAGSLSTHPDDEFAIRLTFTLIGGVVVGGVVVIVIVVSQSGNSDTEARRRSWRQR